MQRISSLRTRIVWVAQIATVAIGFGVTPALYASGQTVDDALFGRIEKALITGDKTTLRDYRSVLQRQVNENQKNAPATSRYALAYTDWRLDQLREKNEADDGFLKEAEANLHILVSADPSNAEAQALLGGVLGQRIGRNGSLGMFLGPKAQRALDRAQKDAPDNPRVALQRGVSAFFTPKMFGGGLDKAEKELRRAWLLFEKEPADKQWPNWGRLDTLAWLGQVLQKKGDIQGARNAYNQSLSLQPDYRWVRDILLPALDRSSSKGSGN